MRIDRRMESQQTPPTQDVFGPTLRQPESGSPGLFYSQVRALTFAQSFYLEQLEAGKLPGGNQLKPAVQALLRRIKELSPDPTSVADQETLAAMREILEQSDVSVSTLTREIKSRLKGNRLKQLFAKFFLFGDRKADKAIEAAASAATKQLLSGGT